jgi:hypothetical protein
VAIGRGNSGGEKHKTMTEKIENHAAAYARSIAKTRGRSEEWVEKAVRKSESITAEEALKLNVIDYVAADVNTLLAAIHQKEIQLIGGKKIISTKNAVIRDKKWGRVRVFFRHFGSQYIISSITDRTGGALLRTVHSRRDSAGRDRRHFAFACVFRLVHAAGKLYGNFADNIRRHFIYRGN